CARRDARFLSLLRSSLILAASSGEGLLERAACSSFSLLASSPFFSRPSPRCKRKTASVGFLLTSSSRINRVLHQVLLEIDTSQRIGVSQLVWAALTARWANVSAWPRSPPFCEI